MTAGQGCKDYSTENIPRDAKGKEQMISTATCKTLLPGVGIVAGMLFLFIPAQAYCANAEGVFLLFGLFCICSCLPVPTVR